MSLIASRWQAVNGRLTRYWRRNFCWSTRRGSLLVDDCKGGQSRRLAEKTSWPVFTAIGLVRTSTGKTVRGTSSDLHVDSNAEHCCPAIPCLRLALRRRPSQLAFDFNIFNLSLRSVAIIRTGAFLCLVAVLLLPSLLSSTSFTPPRSMRCGAIARSAAPDQPLPQRQHIPTFQLESPQTPLRHCLHASFSPVTTVELIYAIPLLVAGAWRTMAIRGACQVVSICALGPIPTFVAQVVHF